MSQGSHPGYPGPPGKYPQGQGLMAKPRRPSAQLRGQPSPAKTEVSRQAASNGHEQPRTASASPASLYPGGPGPDYMRMEAMLGSEVRPSPAKVRTASLEGSESDNSVRSLRSESDPGLADTPGQVAAISSTDPTPDTISGLAEAFKPPSAELGASGGHGSPGGLSLSGHSHGGHQADTQVTYPGICQPLTPWLRRSPPRRSGSGVASVAAARRKTTAGSAPPAETRRVTRSVRCGGATDSQRKR